jgi:hypothetical protein
VKYEFKEHVEEMNKRCEEDKRIRHYPEESGWYSAPSQEYIRQIFLSKLGFN